MSAKKVSLMGKLMLTVMGFVCSYLATTILDFFVLDGYLAEKFLGNESSIVQDIEVTTHVEVITMNYDIKKITASSTLESIASKNGNLNYYPEYVSDSDRSTAWVEGVEGKGIGEYITIYFKDEVRLVSIHLMSGYTKNEKVYSANGRPRQLRVTFSDDSSQLLTLNDSMSEQVFEVEEVICEWAKFEILDVYNGSQYDDTCISEIFFNR